MLAMLTAPTMPTMPTMLAIRTKATRDAIAAKKKRRYRKKKVKISTNSHLHGTEVGREIERQSHLMAGEGRK